MRKKRRQEKAMKKSGTRRVPKEHVGIVLARQKEIEAQFWAAYCRMVWAKIKKLCQEACYGCSHRRLDERDHVTCQMSDVDCIRRFMEMALGDVRCFDVMREWYDALPGLKPPLSENEVLLFVDRCGLPFESEQFECEGTESRVEDVGRSIDLDFIGHDCRDGGSRSNPFRD